MDLLISQAMAAHFTPPSESAGGANTLTIILAVGAVLGLLYMARQKWRRRRSEQDGGGE